MRNMRPLYQSEATLEAQIRAQELNEHAAFCIDIGQYERAISALIEALQLTESTNLDPHLSCCCASCDLDTCMVYSQAYGSVLRNERTMTTKSSSPCHPSSSSCSLTGAYVYRQPIRIPPQVVHGKHTMGMTLPLLLTFNLALVYHMNAISVTARGHKINRSHLQKILQLYELAHRWQSEQEKYYISVTGRSSTLGFSSLKFTMIIANNLGHIHFMVNNITKYQLCMQHLLSTLMLLVDGQQLNQILSNQPFKRFIDIDGFLRNTSCLYLREHAAADA